MSKTRYLNTSFWSDPWVVDHLNILDRHLFIYFLTNEHTNIAGVYEISLKTIANETGFERDEILRMLKRLEPKVKYLDGWLILPNAIKHQNYKSPKIKTGIDAVLVAVPNDIVEFLKFPKDFDAPPADAVKQTKLIVEDINGFDGDNGKEIGHKSVVRTYNSGVSELTTPTPVKYGIDTLSHSNPNVNTNLKPTVTTVEPQPETAGLNKLEGRKFHDIDTLYKELGGLVNDKFKAWYCGVFFKLGREKVLNLASQAKVDGKDPIKLFSYLLQKESGVDKKALSK